jgi:hypothetical protein
MNEITVCKNITVTIKGHTFILSDCEAIELFNKLKDAGVYDPMNPAPTAREPAGSVSVPTPPWWPKTVPASPGYPSSPIWCGGGDRTVPAGSKFFGDGILG